MTLGSAILILAAYLLGSLSFAVILSRIMGLPDPRTYGSHNPGATNMVRTGRRSLAALTLIGDVAKGWLAVALAFWLGPAVGAGAQTPLAAAAAAVTGHFFPVFFGFRGGKGVATGLGVLMALDAWLGLAVLGTWLGVFAFSRTSSLSALVAASLAPVIAWFLTRDPALTAVVAVICAAIVVRHRDNIAKLLAGREEAVEQRPHEPEQR